MADGVGEGVWKEFERVGNRRMKTKLDIILFSGSDLPSKSMLPQRSEPYRRIASHGSNQETGFLVCLDFSLSFFGLRTLGRLRSMVGFLSLYFDCWTSF
jgi:hypothetical protein